ncbi:hypothetical protein BBP40_003916 [Aspergillus hancockii]|nr:hypothetical protein BBP40_003916 [Aspergillus hancockii]
MRNLYSQLQNENCANTVSKRATAPLERPHAEAFPYKSPRLTGVADDLVVPTVLNVDEDKSYWVNLLRIRKSVILSRHRHSGPVHATTLKGRWHYLDHDWWAIPGSYSYEPPGDIHTLEVPEGIDEIATLFHVASSYTYVKSDGTPVGVEDVSTQLEAAKAHHEKVGIGADHVISPGR